MVIGQRRLVALHRGYAQRLLAAHEEERARVAREVHDDAVQRLALLHHELEAFDAETSLPAPQRRRFGGILGEVQDLSASLRQLAHRLHPALIEQAGLVPALAQLAEEMGRGFGLAVHLDLGSSAPALSPEGALVLYRVAQEALRNVAQHAEVAEATVALRATDAEVRLVVADRGRGFDREGRGRLPGLGLIGMNERAQLLGGGATVESRPGEGTTVTVRLPLEGRRA